MSANISHRAEISSVREKGGLGLSNNPNLGLYCSLIENSKDRII